MITGRCLCGAVRFEIDGNVSGYWLCHCSKCRRATGGPFVAAAVCRTAAFRWVAGEGAISEYADSSSYRTGFCGTCGSPVPLVQADEGRVVLPPGTLDAGYAGRLVRHIFVGSQAPWWRITDGAPRFEEHAPAGDSTG